jgi:subfamily B ATP-binding cassette protein MsbA
MRAIRIFNQQDREAQAFAEAAERTRRSAGSIRRISASVVQLVEALVSVLFVVVLIVGYGVGGVSVPELIAFLVLLSRAQPHAKAISRARIELAAVSASVQEVEWLLLQEPAPISLAGSRPTIAIDQPIRFNEVSFHYRDDVPAVHRLNLTIRPGLATALIGTSGSGKTTVVNLLCRLIEPTSGALFHGDVPLTELDPRQWRGRIAIAGQDIDLLDGTVAENIAYGQPEASLEEIELAARTAGADRFIEALENGYDTRLGLETLELSGGERQRLGLARALLKRPDLLILDEAISAVDSIAENEIVKLLFEHRHFRTALVVSHRKSTLSACQDCIVLEDGRLAEAGPLDQSSYYRAMA